jgi:hypothetical protein
MVVGGTGMLRAASVELAARSKRLTSVARTQRSLSDLNAALVDTACEHHMLSLDWDEADHFLAEIKRHLAETEPPELVVAWLHDDELALRLAIELARIGSPIAFVHVIGSTGRDPKAVADTILLRGDLRDTAIRYHQVVLGAHRSTLGKRWLTHEEISAGVLEAIEEPRPRLIVGSVESE